MNMQAIRLRQSYHWAGFNGAYGGIVEGADTTLCCWKKTPPSVYCKIQKAK